MPLASINVPPTTPSPSLAHRYYRVAIMAWAAQALIVVTGAAVRLTQAGLGCENWPSCTDERLVPEWEFHGWVEFGNRLLSFFVVTTVVLAVVGARRPQPRRGDLISLSWGLVAGVVAQILLGGITVLTDLHPLLVSGHFLLSVALLWAATMLVVKAKPAPTPAPPVVAGADVRWAANLTNGAALTVIVVGTLVTGTGPNGGDIQAERLGFELASIARIHAIAAWVLVATSIVYAIKLQQFGPHLARRGQLLVAAVVAQGGIGYLQYWRGVPPEIVIFHIVGAVVVWVLIVAIDGSRRAVEGPKPANNSIPDKKSGHKTGPKGVKEGSEVDTMRS